MSDIITMISKANIYDADRGVTIGAKVFVTAPRVFFKKYGKEFIPATRKPGKFERTLTIEQWNGMEKNDVAPTPAPKPEETAEVTGETTPVTPKKKKTRRTVKG